MGIFKTVFKAVFSGLIESKKFRATALGVMTTLMTSAVMFLLAKVGVQDKQAQAQVLALIQPFARGS